MKIDNLSEMTRGWFVGNFNPSVLKTNDFETAIKRYTAGDKEERHHHKIATEITVIVSGTVKMNNVLYGPDSIITIEPGESTDFASITDAVTVVVKTPCVENDKYINDINIS
jgi:mannose-6-phosphate isomerase-like protein (cupin superfamily)